MKSKTNFTTERLVQTALLVAIILLMAFTPIGYIKTLGLEITLIVVPVTIGAIALGAAGGALLGGVFGVTSFIQCFGMNPFGAALLGINPWATFIVCIVPRILMGWLTGLIFEGFKKTKVNKNLAFAVTNLAGPLLNTIFFMSGLILFFYHTDYIQEIASTLGVNNAFTFAIAFVGVNSLVETSACFVLGTAVSKALDVYKTKSGRA